MKPIEIKKRLGIPVFTHDMISSLLKENISNVNDKISNLVKSGDIIRLKRGIYIFGADYRDELLDLVMIANMLYAPSYVSFDYALSYYGMIPERVDEISSATIRHNKFFDTSIGNFSYTKIPMGVYYIGVDWVYDNKNGGKLIARPEKALCDKIRYDRGIGTLTQTQMIGYLTNDLRLDISFKLDISMIEYIAKIYKSKNLKTLAIILKKYGEHI